VAGFEVIKEKTTTTKKTTLSKNLRCLDTNDDEKLTTTKKNPTMIIYHNDVYLKGMVIRLGWTTSDL